MIVLLDGRRVPLRGIQGPRLIPEVSTFGRLLFPLRKLLLPFVVARDGVILQIRFQRDIVEFLSVLRPFGLVDPEVTLIVLEVKIVVCDSLLLQFGQAVEPFD